MSNAAYAPDKILYHRDTLEVLREGGTCYPLHLHLIISDLCNLDCPGCSYRMSGYTSNQLFSGPNGERNPVRFLEPELVRKVLDDCKAMGTRAVEFSVWEEEVIPIQDGDGTRTVKIGDFVDTLFGRPGDGRHEELDVRGRGYSSYAINDEGRVVCGEIEAVYRHAAPEAIFEVTLETGRSTFLTGSHGINVVRSGRIVKVPVRELTPGERVACGDWKGRGVLPHDLAVPALEKGGIGVKERIRVDAALFRLLGYFTAEGSSSTQRGGVAHGLGWYFGTGPRDEAYRNDVTHLCREVFGVQAHPAPGKEETAVALTSKQATEVFASLGALGVQAERHVPWIVWDAPAEFKMEYLQGLFSGDGNFRSTHDAHGYRRNSLHLKTCNRSLAHEVFALLRQLGVNASIGKGTSPKREIDGRILNPSDYYVVNVYDSGSLSKLGSVLEGLGSTPEYIDSPLSRRKAKLRSEAFGLEAYTLRVKSVREATELGRPMVYDITVAGTHRFLTVAGIGCFNTGGGEPTVHPQCKELLEYAQSLDLDTALITNGISLPRIGDAAVRTQWLRISLDAATPETFAIVRPGFGSKRVELFDKVCRSIRWAVQRKQDLGAPCTIGVGFVVQRDNWRELRQAVALAYQLGADNIRISGLFSTEGDAYHADFRAEAEAIERRAIEDFDGIERAHREPFRVFGRYCEKLSDLAGPPQDPRCSYSRVTTYLGGDGNLYRCCVTSYNKHGLLGNVRAAGGLKALWDDPKTQRELGDFDARSCVRCQFNDRLRAIHAAIDAPEMPASPDTPPVHPFFV